MPLVPLNNELEEPRQVGGLKPLDDLQAPQQSSPATGLVPLGTPRSNFGGLKPLGQSTPMDGEWAQPQRPDPTPLSAYDELPFLAKVGVEALRAPTNFKTGALNIFGSVFDTALIGLNESGIVEDETAEQWRKWGRKTNQLLAQGGEGFLLNEAIKRIADAPPGTDLAQVTAETDNFFTGDLMQGLGSLAAFALTSRLLGPQFVRAGMTERMAQFAGAGILGSVVNSNALYHDAVEHEATGWQKGVAWAAGAVTGPLEAVSIGRMLNRFDKVGASAFTKLLEKGADPWRAFSATQAASAGLKGILEEGAQEFAQEWLGNVTAATIAGYDPDRSYMDNVWAAGGTGAATGFIGSAFLAAMGVRAGRIKALRAQEWETDADGRAKPPEESGWEAVEGGYRKGNLFISPVDDGSGHTRWQLRNTKGEKGAPPLIDEDEIYGTFYDDAIRFNANDAQAVKAVQDAWDRGDYIYREDAMESGVTRLTTLEQVQNANPTDLEIIPLELIQRANAGADVLGSWLKVETAATLGDRFLRQGHLGRDLQRSDFFGEFNAITEMHYELTKKRQDIIGRIKEEAIKLERNAEWHAQFEKLAEQFDLYHHGGLTPVRVLLGKKSTAAQKAQVEANILGMIGTDTHFGLLNADRAVSARQIIMPTSFADNRLQLQHYISDSDRVFPGKKGTPGSGPVGLFKLIEEADARAQKDGSPLVIYSRDKNKTDPLTDKKVLAYVDNYVNSAIVPAVTKAISRANYTYESVLDEKGASLGVDKDGKPITRQVKPAVIIRLNFGESNANGFALSMREAHTFMVEISAGEMLYRKRQLDKVGVDVESKVQDALKNKIMTPGEAKDFRREFVLNRRRMLEKATKKITDTLAHELGHFITMNKVKDLFIKYNNKTATELEVATLKAMYQSYFEYLHAADTKDGLRDIAYGEMLTRLEESAEGFKGATNKEKIIDLINHVEDPALSGYWKPSLTYGQYRRGFEEFLANQVARVYANEPLTELEKQAAAPIRDAIKDLKKLAEDLNKHFPDTQGARPYKGVKDIVDLMDIDSAIRTSGALENLAPKTVRDVINNKVEGFDPDVVTAFNEGMDSFSKAHDLMLNLVQIAKLNPHVEPLQAYLGHVQGWARRVGQTTSKADETLKLARTLKVAGKEKGAVLGKVFFHEAENGEFLTLQEKQDLTGNKWTEEMQQVYDSVKKNYREILERMRKVTLEDAQRNFAAQPDRLAAVEAKINKDFDEMAAKPYFPFMRFGKWTVTVKAGKEFVDTDGESYKPGQIVRFEAFDSRFDRARTMKRLQAKYGKEHIVGQGRMSDVRGSLQAMPISFLRAMQSRLEQKLPQDVRDELNEIIQEYSPGESFRQAHMKRRKGTKGYNLDWQRSFAAYMRQAAGHIARMEFQPLMTESIKEMEADVKILNQTANGDKRSMMLDWMKTHEEYILNPSIEWAGLRGFMFQWFLGFNLKSAVVNATQIPLVTYPYLGARYGDTAAWKEIFQAQADALIYYRDPKKMPHRRGEQFAAGEVQMIEELLDRQILEQSLATELALAASSQHLERYVVGPGIKRGWFKASEWGAMPFHTVEKLNRMVSALAGYRLARDSGAGHAEAVNIAHDTVLKTQYDYSKWNRPRFMRGRKGVVFLFMNYVQNTLFFGLGGDPGALRHQMMLLLFAGLMGLPFMEDLITLFNWGSTKIKRQLGMKDPYTDLRVEMREFASELVNNPDLFLQGIGSDSLGLGPLGRMAGLGAWTPQFDITASISMGRIIPGVDVLREQGGNFEAGLVRGVERSGGAFVSTAIQGMRALASEDPNTWKRIEKAMPAFARNASRAARMTTQGEEVTRGGEVIAEFDWRNPRDAMEIGLMGVGFQPRKTSLGWQGYIHSRQPVLYYESWKRQIARQFNFAMSSGDREAIADMRKAVRKYNEAVPFPEMSITGDYIRQSYQSYMQQQQKGRQGLPDSLNNYRLQKRVEEVFDPQTSPDN